MNEDAPDEGGIVFFRTASHDEVVEFYTERVGMRVLVDQPECTVLERDGFHLGFCERDPAETEGVITFLYPDRAGVDAAHEELADVARGEPEHNDPYQLYQFFAEDPEGRTVEFQTFE